MAGEWVVKQEGEKRRLIINFKGLSFAPDVAQYAEAMRFVVDTLQQVEADELVLSEFYERIYSEDQTRMLRSIADLVNKFETEGVWSPSHLGKMGDEGKILQARHARVLELVNLTHSDPFKAYMDLLALIKDESVKGEKLVGAAGESHKIYLGTLLFLKAGYEETYIIQQLRKHIAQLGSIPVARSVYVPLFEVAIKPAFIGSRIFFGGTESLELIDQYDVMGAQVQVFKHPEKIEYMYYLNPPEYTLPPEKYYLLERTKEVVAGQRPPDVGFMDMAQARRYFHKIYVATISDLAQKSGIELTVEEKANLATIVARYTIGYGILEILLNDRKLTDIYIDSPLGNKPIYLVHSKYGQCQTNVIYSDEEARSFVSRMRALSGRPFDEAHCVLDYDLVDLQTRIAVIGKPMALDGIAFAMRLHKDTPWTLAQFLDFKMFTPIASGLFSYLVDAQASQLIVGSRGSGKTSMMQALMLEIPQNLRILVQEDSVTADSALWAEREGRIEQTTIGQLVDGLMEQYGSLERPNGEVLVANPEHVKVFAMDREGRMRLAPVSRFIRHRVRKPLYRVTTRSGRQIKVTADHSLFTLGEDGQITPVKTSQLQKGSRIAAPRKLPFPEGLMTGYDAWPFLRQTGTGFIQSKALQPWLRENRSTLQATASELGYSKRALPCWIRQGILPACVAQQLEARLPLLEDAKFKVDARSKPIPIREMLDEEFLELVGLWLADGCYDGKYSVLFSVGDPAERAVVTRAASRFGLKPRTHTDEFSQIISNTNLVFLWRTVLGLEGNAYTKRLPEWALNLSRAQTAALLRGLFSGDGTVGHHEVTLSTCSPHLRTAVETLLQRYGICTRTIYRSRDKTFMVRVSGLPFLQAFQREIGFLQGYKQERLARLCARTSTHDTTDTIPLSAVLKQKIAAQVATGFNKHDYLSRGNDIGRTKLASLAAPAGGALEYTLQTLADNDLYWDEVRSVEELPLQEQTVYDLSVPECESFVCEGLVAHNTQELPVPQMKKLGFNIQRLKTRPPLGGISEGEVSAEDALRTALRLGDSVLIVGEVRSGEAKALYEAMRVGAVGNVVMGTIHGESAYSIWDRVVNDLGVPTTSFKATDFCIVGAPIRFKGSLKRQRRIIEVTEVKKEWTRDPGEEHGFLEWMRFDASRDSLDLFEDELKESEWLKKVQRMRGLTFEELWSEITTRAASKQYLVDIKRKLDIPKLLEAENTVRAHSKLMLLAEKQREEFGSMDHEQLLKDWKKWVDETLVAEQVQLKRLESA